MKSAITKAKKRLGHEPFHELFALVVKPIATVKHKGCFFHKWRIVAVDGSTMSIQNTDENKEYFGIRFNQFGEVGYPYIKFVSLVECGTHVNFAANTGGLHISEEALFIPLVEQLKPIMILLADRLYYSFTSWKRCDSRGTALLWRVYKNLKLACEKKLSDGSYLARIKPSKSHAKRKKCSVDDEMTLRVIEYQVEFEDGSMSEPVRLITNLLDPSDATSDELARLYAERWSIETGFDELKSHLKGSGRVLRGQLPQLVEQEVYGLLLAYFVFLQ